MATLRCLSFSHPNIEPARSSSAGVEAGFRVIRVHLVLDVAFANRAAFVSTHWRERAETDQRECTIQTTRDDPTGAARSGLAAVQS